MRYKELTQQQKEYERPRQDGQPDHPRAFVIPDQRDYTHNARGRVRTGA